MQVEESDSASYNSSSGIRVSSPTSISDYVCKVCGYHATGHHYRVLSCNACRAFFRRMALNECKDKEPYECGLDGNCAVFDKTKGMKNRTACQACRFQRCLKLGMNIEGVTKPIARSGRHPVSVKSRFNVNNRGPVIVDDNMILRSTRIIISTSYLGPIS